MVTRDDTTVERLLFITRKAFSREPAANGQLKGGSKERILCLTTMTQKKPDLFGIRKGISDNY